MKLYDAFSIILDLTAVVRHALPPTLRQIWANPTIVFQPLALSRFFMFHVWGMLADGVDRKRRQTKEELITPHASGIVLDLGAGMVKF
jgi:hypothetical protein